MRKILLAATILGGLSWSAMASPTFPFTCTGEFQKGEGMAGIEIGSTCHIQADSHEQDQVDSVCNDGVTCEVKGIVTVKHDRDDKDHTWLEFIKVFRVKKLSDEERK
jgi:hypothetical protein